MNLARWKKRKGRALLVTLPCFVLLAVALLQRADPPADFYAWIEPRPGICRVVRPFFAIAGQGAHFDARIQWAMFARHLLQVERRTLVQQMLCPSHIPPASPLRPKALEEPRPDDGFNPGRPLSPPQKSAS